MTTTHRIENGYLIFRGVEPPPGVRREDCEFYYLGGKWLTPLASNSGFRHLETYRVPLALSRQREAEATGRAIPCDLENYKKLLESRQADPQPKPEGGVPHDSGPNAPPIDLAASNVQPVAAAQDSPTPRTDAAIIESDGRWTFPIRDFARQLEKENNILRAALLIEPADKIVLDQPPCDSVLIDCGSIRKRVCPTSDEAVRLERELADANAKLKQSENCLFVLKEHIKRIAPELETLVAISREAGGDPAPAKNCEARPALPTVWHNPDKVPLDKIPDGWRLMVPEEVDGRYFGKCRLWVPFTENWTDPNCCGNVSEWTYLVHADTAPLPQS